MNRRFSVTCYMWVMAFFLLFPGLPAFSGESATREECVAMAERALKMIRTQGLDAVIPRINDKNGPFLWKDSYVCLMDTRDARLLAHPYLPKSRIGISLIKARDIHGKEFFREFLNVANSKGSGWVDYIHADTNGVAREKITYVVKSDKDNVIALAGIYTDKKVAGPVFDFPEMVLPDIGGRKVAFIIANKGYEDTEFSVPKKMVERAGGVSQVFSLSRGKAYGMYGQITDVPFTLDEIQVKDFDAVVFVGGSGSRVYHKNPAAHKIAREAVRADKVLGAICWAPVILANADVIKGKMVTVNPIEKERFEKDSCLYTGDTVTVDGKLITANGPGASAFFGKAIIEALKL